MLALLGNLKDKGNLRYGWLDKKDFFDHVQKVFESVMDEQISTIREYVKKKSK